MFNIIGYKSATPLIQEGALVWEKTLLWKFLSYVGIHDESPC
jgi:hypothetical protein